jgi:hypothetical protein
MKSTWIFALLLCITTPACSSDSGGNGGSGTGGSGTGGSGTGGSGTGGSSGGSCDGVVDTCSKVPLAQVNSTLGTQADQADPHDASDSFFQSSVCDYYEGNGQVATISRNCIKDGPSAANLFYDAEHDKPNQTIEELTGVGDRAFIRYDDASTSAELFYQKGSEVVVVRSLTTADHSVSKPQLLALAQLVLAL